LPAGGRIRILACMDDTKTTLRRTRRTMLGIVLLGATGPLLAAAPRWRVAAARLDAALAASVRAPDCTVSGHHFEADARWRCMT